MEENNISYLCHESDMVRMERANRRLFIALVVSLIALVISRFIPKRYTSWVAAYEK